MAAARATAWALGALVHGLLAPAWASAATAPPLAGFQRGGAQEAPQRRPGVVPEVAPATAVGAGRADVAPRGGALDPVARDRRTGFDTGSAQAARLDLGTFRPGDPRRAVALVTLGAAGAVFERQALMTAAAEGVLEDRVAALLALGELGPGLGDGLGVLERFAVAESGQLQAACLVALARANAPAARAVLARLASGEGVLATLARDVMAHAIDPAASPPPAQWQQLYALRWEGARRYGTVDGRPWRIVRVDELALDNAFLEQLVLLCAPDLSSAAARDLLLELVLSRSRALGRIDAAVQLFPAELEQLVDSGVWRPANRAEWLRLVEEIVRREDWRRFPTTLGQAAVLQDARPLVAGFMQRAGGPFEEALLDAFDSDDARDRANAAYSVGAAGLVDHTATLRELSRDPEPWVAASALAARVRMGESAAVRELEEFFAEAEARRPARMTGYLCEYLERALPDEDVLQVLERISPTLEGADRLNVEALLVLGARTADTRYLRESLASLDPNTPETFRVIRALGHQPKPEDLEALAGAFPFDGSGIANLHAARALVLGRHRSVDPLLAGAVWRLDLELALLAAGTVYETRGAQLLRQWVARPPAFATDEDLRRVGFALGEWGGPREVEALRADLGTASGAEEPALQGALLGMLSARTR